MAWRIIGINNPAKLNTSHSQLVIEQDQTVTVPIEDIDAVVIDSYGILLTGQLLTDLSENGVTTVISNNKHLPNTIILPLSQHSRQAKITQLHLSAKPTLQKKLWRAIIIQKIHNQASILKLYNLVPEPLFILAKTVQSNDKGNNESVAAKIYFKQLLEQYNRQSPIWQNSALNYGYAIIRSHIARHIAARGLVPSLGLHHHSELNSFNLADDIIEPFRPFVDNLVIKLNKQKIETSNYTALTKDDRQEIVGIMNEQCFIKSKLYPLRAAVEITINSLVSCFEAGLTDGLILPSVPNNRKICRTKL